MYKLFGMLIYFGLVNVSCTSKYWSTKSLYHGLWARSVMSRDRFKSLMAMLHVVDPATEEAGGKLRKLKSFLDYFKGRCKSLYQPTQNVAVDERMVKSRHRSGIWQYIKDKPTKWGIKLWVVADSANGYTFDFDVYVGRDPNRELSEHGLGYDVVMKLMQPLLEQGYHLYIDNFYTSVPLVTDLFRLGVGTTGTISERRRGFPANMKNSKEWAKRKQRGSMRWERTPPCLAVQWKDNKVVSMLTTIENANDHFQVNRKQKTNNVWRQANIPQPAVIKSYNSYMNAVDRSDQILGTHNVLRKCTRWYKVLIFHVIDIAATNGFILFRDYQAAHPEIGALQRQSGFSFVDFREELVRQLCGFDEYDLPPVDVRVRPPGQFQLSEHVMMFSDNRRNCKVCYQQGRGEKKVSSYCSAPQCQGVYLHNTKENLCFREWHTTEYHH